MEQRRSLVDLGTHGNPFIISAAVAPERVLFCYAQLRGGHMRRSRYTVTHRDIQQGTTCEGQNRARWLLEQWITCVAPLLLGCERGAAAARGARHGVLTHDEGRLGHLVFEVDRRAVEQLQRRAVDDHARAQLLEDAASAGVARGRKRDQGDGWEAGGTWVIRRSGRDASGAGGGSLTCPPPHRPWTPPQSRICTRSLSSPPAPPIAAVAVAALAPPIPCRDSVARCAAMGHVWARGGDRNHRTEAIFTRHEHVTCTR